MRRSILILCILSLGTAEIRAQEPPREGWGAVPSIGFGWLGRRWSGGSDGNTVDLGPGPFPQFALALQHRTPGKLTYDLQFGLTPTEFGADIEQDSVGFRAIGVGRLNLVRMQAGILYRLRPDVPGYFSLGAGANYIHVVRPFARWQHESGIAPSAHVGAGYDANSGSHAFRFDARLHLTRGAKTVESPIGPLEPHFAADLLFSIGYLVGF